MSLTANDLKQIRKVMREEVKAEIKDVENNLSNQMRMTKFEMRRDTDKLDDRMKNVEIRLDNSQENSEKLHKQVMKKLTSIEKTVSLIAKNYDEGDVALAKRVTNIERHLDLPQN